MSDRISKVRYVPQEKIICDRVLNQELAKVGLQNCFVVSKKTSLGNRRSEVHRTLTPDRTRMQLDSIDNPFLEMLGASLESWEPDKANFRLSVEKKHLNRQGTLQGGVISTLLDAACGYSSLYVAPGEIARHASTLSLTINFISKVDYGTVYALGVRTGGGRNIFFASGELVNENGKLIATATGTFKYSTPRP